MGFVYNLLLFPMVKKCENRLGFDQLIAISWVVHCFWDTVYMTAMYSGIYTHNKSSGSSVEA